MSEGQRLRAALEGSERFALDGRRRDLAAGPRVVTVTTYADRNARDLATMEADRDDALREVDRMRAAVADAEGVALGSERYAAREWERANRAEAALAVAGDELRNTQDSLRQVVRELHRLRAGIHDLADRWSRMGATGAALSRLLLAFLNNPQETRT